MHDLRWTPIWGDSFFRIKGKLEVLIPGLDISGAGIYSHLQGGDEATLVVVKFTE